MDVVTNPKEIENKSMKIIEDLLGEHNFNEAEKSVVKRIIHTTGDPQYSALVKFHPEAIERGIKALQQGASVYTDVKMVQAGINSQVLGGFGGKIYCGISDPEIVQKAQETGLTRAMIAFRSWGRKLNGNIVAIGNAPTGLFELLRLAREEGVQPALVVGIPVGFVGAAESKEVLLDSGLPYITISGTKGGSTITVATINALLYLAAAAR